MGRFTDATRIGEISRPPSIRLSYAVTPRVHPVGLLLLQIASHVDAAHDEDSTARQGSRDFIDEGLLARADSPSRLLMSSVDGTDVQFVQALLGYEDIPLASREASSADSHPSRVSSSCSHR